MDGVTLLFLYIKYNKTLTIEINFLHKSHVLQPLLRTLSQCRFQQPVHVRQFVLFRQSSIDGPVNQTHAAGHSVHGH